MCLPEPSGAMTDVLMYVFKSFDLQKPGLREEENKQSVHDYLPLCELDTRSSPKKPTRVRLESIPLRELRAPHPKLDEHDPEAAQHAIDL